ncbi:MAG: HDOD domain-containing protein [Azoarcus sp.]|jgi:HD-like signal output (HDOD) protein|nr:HDOD domain-containing protein [Azoarcus sp.]
MHSAQELVANIESLAVLPAVYYCVREQLESPEVSISKVVLLMEADPALAASVLKLVNSAFYGFSRKIESVERAIPILGLQQTHELVLAMSVSSVFKGIRPLSMDMKQYWQGCMLTALAARELAHATCNPASERLFVIGLLADIGHLVMYLVIPDLAVSAQNAADAGHEPLHTAERRIIGCDFAETGAALMNTWGLPRSFAETIGAQITPQLAGKRTFEAELLHLALAISKADRYNESSEEALARIDPRIWADLGLAPESFPKIRESAEMNLGSCTDLFFPGEALSMAGAAFMHLNRANP